MTRGQALDALSYVATEAGKTARGIIPRTACIWYCGTTERRCGSSPLVMWSLRRSSPAPRRCDSPVT